MSAEMVRAAAYGTSFALAFDAAWRATDSGPRRQQEALAKVDVERCKAVAEAAVKGYEAKGPKSEVSGIVYCTVCHKDHAVEPSETPCGGEGSWIPKG